MKELKAFYEEHQPSASYLVSMEPKARKIIDEGCVIEVLPVQDFLRRLWSDQIIS